MYEIKRPGEGVYNVSPVSEPATFRYIREGAEITPGFQGGVTATLETALFRANTRGGMAALGPELVGKFGSSDTKRLAAAVEVVAEQDLRKDPKFKPAKNAARWARRAKKRALDGDHWVEGGPPGESRMSNKRARRMGRQSWGKPDYYGRASLGRESDLPWYLR